MAEVRMAAVRAAVDAGRAVAAVAASPHRAVAKARRRKRVIRVAATTAEPRNRKAVPRSLWAIVVLMAVQRNRQTMAHAVVVRANPLPRKSVSVQAG